MPIGTVNVTCPDGSNLVARYEVTDGYSTLRATHFYAGLVPPSKSAPGKFPFQHARVDATSDEFVIPLSSLGVTSLTCLYFAAHAEVDAPIAFRPPDLDWYHEQLPDMAGMVVSYPGGGDSYLDAEISNGGVINGVYDDWCIDTDNTIFPGDFYNIEVLSSYELLPPGLVEFPENLDLVNYILNAGFIGMPSTGGPAYTFGDVQRAIWHLLEDVVEGEGLGPWDQVRVDEILADARANGEGYRPGCGDLIAVVLHPVDEESNTVAQVTIIEAPFRCPAIMRRQSAWGAGPFPFPSGWGSYFPCCMAP